MIGFRVSDGRRGTFLETSKVGALMAKRTEAGLSRFGAFVWRRAKSSIKDGQNKGRVSLPGRPPLGHTRALRSRILFALDRAAQSVVIGPTPYRDGTGAQALEEGGTQAVVKNGHVVVYRYRARPFMLPAFEAELDDAAEGWRE
jgi:hypothetical protein